MTDSTKPTEPTAEKSNTPTKGMVVGESSGSRLSFKKLNLKYILAGAVLIIIIAAGYLIYQAIKSPTVSAVCNTSVIQNANTQLETGSDSGLVILIGQIKAKTGYVNDPNCLYIIAESQIQTNDLTSAQSSIKTLNDTFGSHYVFNNKLGGGHASISTLQNQFNTAKNAQENLHGRMDPGV